MCSKDPHLLEMASLTKTLSKMYSDSCSAVAHDLPGSLVEQICRIMGFNFLLRFAHGNGGSSDMLYASLCLAKPSFKACSAPMSQVAETAVKWLSSRLFSKLGSSRN